MDRATLTLIGTAEYLGHLARTRSRGRARQQALAALDRVKKDLIQAASVHAEALGAARDLLRATAESLRVMFQDDVVAPGQFDGVDEVTLREVYPPPLPSSSSSDGGPIRSLPPTAVTPRRRGSRRQSKR